MLLVDRRRAQQRVQPLPVGELAAERDDRVEPVRPARPVRALGRCPRAAGWGTRPVPRARSRARRCSGAEDVLVVAVGGEDDPLARELREHVEQRLDLLGRDRRDHVDAVLRVGVVEDLLPLHERQEPQRELLAAGLRAARCRTSSARCRARSTAAASGSGPAATRRRIHVAQHHRVHERVVRDRERRTGRRCAPRSRRSSRRPRPSAAAGRRRPRPRSSRASDSC